MRWQLWVKWIFRLPQSLVSLRQPCQLTRLRLSVPCQCQKDNLRPSKKSFTIFWMQLDRCFLAVCKKNKAPHGFFGIMRTTVHYYTEKSQTLLHEARPDMTQKRQVAFHCSLLRPFSSVAPFKKLKSFNGENRSWRCCRCLPVKSVSTLQNWEFCLQDFFEDREKNLLPLFLFTISFRDNGFFFPT